MQSASTATTSSPRVEVVPYVGRWGGARNDQERVVPVILLLGLNSLLQIVDAYSTVVGLRMGGREVNPLMAGLLAAGGPTLFLLAKVVVIVGLALTAVLVARRRSASIAMHRVVLGLTMFVTLVVASNTAQIGMALW